MLTKEYRICMPLSVEEYRIGQLYMIAKHSHEQSEKGEGVEVVKNEPCEHEKFGTGQYTEKRIHLSSRLPTWIQSVIPKVFYITEKAWNYYPYTTTEYTCSFIPNFQIEIQTKYENNNGSSENVHELNAEQLVDREVIMQDIAFDDFPEHKYKPEEDPRTFKSTKTGRGPLEKGWMDKSDPIMCSYKLVKVKFEVWGLQTRVEDYIQSVVKDILLLGHRQAFAWIDEWHDMKMEDLRNYEKKMNTETNKKVGAQVSDTPLSVEPSTPTNTPTGGSTPEAEKGSPTEPVPT